MPHQLSLGETIRSTQRRFAPRRGAIAHAASQVQSTIADMGQSTTRRINEGRGAAAQALEVAAESVQDNADRLRDLGHEAAASLGATAHYIRKRRARAILADVEGLVQAHPRKALVAAAVIGFLTGRLFRAKRRS